MVSSKWFQVVSPSPFRFFAALMPPCAHTECERFTGTTENRSTLPPASAILMTAERPANPPPTTTILGAFTIALCVLDSNLADVVLRMASRCHVMGHLMRSRRLHDQPVEHARQRDRRGPDRLSFGRLCRSRFVRTVAVFGIEKRERAGDADDDHDHGQRSANIPEAAA